MLSNLQSVTHFKLLREIKQPRNSIFSNILSGIHQMLLVNGLVVAMETQVIQAPYICSSE